MEPEKIDIKAESVVESSTPTSIPSSTGLNINVIELITKLGWPIVSFLLLFYYILPKLDRLIELQTKTVIILENLIRK